MNYYEIGQKIRKYRRKKGLSQEQLAEAVNISVTHMSHIETGNTKLSLQVMADISEVLQVSVDELLFSRETGGGETAAKLAKILAGCNKQQLELIIDVAKTIKSGTDALFDKTI